VDGLCYQEQVGWVKDNENISKPGILKNWWLVVDR